MAWIYLLIAGILEIACTTIFRYTAGMTRVVPTVAFFAISILSFYYLNRSLDGIPLGTAYAVWTGMGAAGTVILGIAFYDEPTHALHLVFLVLLIGSIIGLKLVSSH